MARKKRYSLKFTGELAKPIETKRLSVFDLPLSAEGRRAWLRKFEVNLLAAQVAKLPLLMQHYGIERSGSEWDKVELLALVLALATDIVPGFEPDIVAARTRGAPRKYDNGALFGLLVRVGAAKLKDASLSEPQICEQLVVEDHPDLKGARFRSRREAKAKTLLNILALARRTKAGDVLLSEFVDDLVNRVRLVASRKIDAVFPG